MFDREDFARAMSFVTLVITIAPLVAPMIGGHLAIWFGWRSIFWVLAFFAVIVIALVWWQIPETLKVEKRNYLKLCCNKTAMGLILSGAFSFSGMFAFLTAGSFVYIDIYGISPDQFGYLFGLNIVAMIIMTSLNGRMVKKVGSHFMLRLGLTVQLIAGLGLFVSWLLDLGLWGTVPFVVLFIGTLSTIGSNAMALLLSGYPFGTGSLVGALVAILPSGVTWPMVLVMSACSVLSALFYWIFGRKA